MNLADKDQHHSSRTRLDRERLKSCMRELVSGICALEGLRRAGEGFGIWDGGKDTGNGFHRQRAGLDGILGRDCSLAGWFREALGRVEEDS